MRTLRQSALAGRAAAIMLLAATVMPAAPALAASTDVRDLGARPPTVDLARPHASDAVLVRFADQAATADKTNARRSAGAVSSRAISALAHGVERLQLGGGVSVEQAIAALKANPRVIVAEPDYVLTKSDTSDDPYYTSGALWGMEGDGSTPANAFGSAAAEAWVAGYTGSRNVVVGVIDEGIQYTHPDLAANIWTNPGETAGDGIDNDHNGYIDDVHGWDFFSHDNSIYDGSPTSTVDSHGTHVSGTIGGVGKNGLGVAGVNWQVTIVSAKFLGPSGGNTSDAISALDYLTDLKVNHGVNLIASSNSWGGGGFDQLLLDAINRSGNAGMLFVAAAGNNNTNTDVSANYPSTYQCTNGGTRGWDCVIAVAAIDSAGARASFSNYGATTVDLGAPGVDVNSTLPTNTYGSYSGTSMATPHVSGAVALCKSMNPGITAQDIKAAIMASSKPTTSMSGTTVTGGRLDIGGLVPLCAPRATAPVAGGPDNSLTATATSTSRISLSWTDGATNEDSWEIQHSPSGCSSWTTIASGGRGTTSFEVTGLQPSTPYCFRVRAVNAYNGGTQSPWSNIAQATTQSPPPPYACTATTYAWIDASAGGTSRALTDDSSAPVTLPFTFGFYGDPTTSVQVSSNGYLRMGTGAATAYANAAIPNAADPNAFIAAFWDDLNPGAGGSVWTRTVGSAPNRQFVAEWLNVPHYSVAGSALTFEIILEESTGAITIQYQDVVAGNVGYDYGASATSGIENAAGTAGTQISYNQATLANLTAKRCTNSSGPTPPAITTTTLPDGTTGSAYSAFLQATGGSQPYGWSISSGNLPSGLTLNAGTGEISGTPTTAATSTFGVTVTGNDGASSSSTLSIRVASPLSVTTTTLPGGTVGSAYSANLAATGGQTPYTWSISIGSLPPGLTLNASTGAITGTPTTNGTSNFTVQVTDAGQPTARVATKAHSITVTGSSTAPGAFNKLSPKNSARLSTTTSVTLSWSASAGATSYEVCVSTSNGTCTSWFNVGNVLTYDWGGLLPRTNYWWQVRASNGTTTTLANAGSWWKFSTR